ncbi:DUF2950 family protein [Rhizobium herbae]|uniref:DUF2950 family protein n=1 Tax=Rhizobium herbae TaxID=508661 RepID=A0ABS7HFG5_9HYPH|nr:DUF2950 family protein [Rhizobium herbae]
MWPVRYAETCVEAFVVIQQVIVYERDLGPKRRRRAGAAVNNTSHEASFSRSQDQ